MNVVPINISAAKHTAGTVQPPQSGWVPAADT
jgi:hypothetical protein